MLRVLSPALATGCRIRAGLFVLALAAQAAAQQTPLRETRLLFTIGDQSDDVDRDAFASIGAVHSAADGRIYVASGRPCHIKVFDARGMYVSNFGRQGGGPGEFACATGFSFDLVDSTVRVNDRSQNRYVVFTLAGEHVRTTMRPTFDGDDAFNRSVPMAHGYRLRAEGTPVALGDGSRWFPHTSVVLRKDVPPQTTTLASIRQDVVALTTNGRPTPGIAGFGRGGWWLTSGDSIVIVVDGYEGVATWHRIGPTGPTLEQTLRFSPPGREVTRADRTAMERRLAEQMSGRGLTVQSWSNPPPRWSVADWAFIADDGALWIGTIRRQGPPVRWTVIPADGPQFAVEFPAAEWVTAAREDRVFVSTTNADDVPVLRVYELGR